MGSLADPAIMRQKHENLKAKRGSLNRRSGSQEKPTSTPLIAKLLTSPHLHQYSNEQVQKNVRVQKVQFGTRYKENQWIQLFLRNLDLNFKA